MDLEKKEKDLDAKRLSPAKALWSRPGLTRLSQLNTLGGGVSTNEITTSRPS